MLSVPPMTMPVFQSSIPYDPRIDRRLPGVQPLGDAPWIVVDDRYAEQMALRDRLISDSPQAVLARTGSAKNAEQELFDLVLGNLPDGFDLKRDSIVRPDGVSVPLDRDHPMATLGRILQEDLCLMHKGRDEDAHRLISAVLCFPARWNVHDKIGKPLVPIHAPVAEYDGDVARRVQRLFDGIQVGRPIWRYNKLWDQDPALHQPKPRHERPKWVRETAPFMRSERQCLVRLPQTKAILFSIHTYILERATLEAQWDA